MDAKELLREALKQGGYDGLCCPEEECGCQIDDLIPCGSDPSLCSVAKNAEDAEGHWIMVEA